jgi:hypothetical protein
MAVNETTSIGEKVSHTLSTTTINDTSTIPATTPDVLLIYNDLSHMSNNLDRPTTAMSSRMRFYHFDLGHYMIEHANRIPRMYDICIS